MAILIVIIPFVLFGTVVINIPAFLIAATEGFFEAFREQTDCRCPWNIILPIITFPGMVLGTIFGLVTFMWIDW